jgi:hypothetical protein
MNRSRYLPPQGGTQPDYRSQEFTVSLEDEKDQVVSYPRLQLTLNSKLKGGQELMFGTHPNRCDIIFTDTAVHQSVSLLPYI